MRARSNNEEWVRRLALTSGRPSRSEGRARGLKAQGRFHNDDANLDLTPGLSPDYATDLKAEMLLTCN